MAASFGSAQHYVECDNCEENPAKFVCKTCPGHLCTNCKTEHENRKMTKNHEITELNTNNKELICLLYCSDHKTKKLECFCNPCQKPVCTECIVRSHNGHAVQSLSTAFQRIRDDLKKTNEEIQQNLLPKYMELLKEEDDKKSTLTTQADEIEKQIEIHTQNAIKSVTEISKSTVKNLRASEQKGLREIDKARSQIQRTIERLKTISKDLSAEIEAKPGISHIKHANSNLLEEFKSFPERNNYILHNFQPGEMEPIIRSNFGTMPYLQTIKTQTNISVFKFGNNLEKNFGGVSSGGFFWTTTPTVSNCQAPATPAFQFGGGPAHSSSGPKPLFGGKPTAPFSFGVTKSSNSGFGSQGPFESK